MDAKLKGEYITVLIPAYNEESRIVKCLESCLPIAKRIILLDNMSTDSTCDIARAYGAEVVRTEKTYKERLAEAITREDIDTPWVFYIDADEEVTPEAAQEMLALCQKHMNDSVNGIVCRYRKVFMGKDLYHSGSSEWKMRLFKNGAADFETNVELDEHMVLKSGDSVRMRHCIRHFSFRDINHLTLKQNGFARRKAEELIRIEDGAAQAQYQGLAGITKLRRFIKFNIYYKLPIGMRARAHYIWMLIFKLGFLDGLEGKLYLFYRIYWYGMLVDTYYLEMRRSAAADGAGEKV